MSVGQAADAHSRTRHESGHAPVGGSTRVVTHVALAVPTGEPFIKCLASATKVLLVAHFCAWKDHAIGVPHNTSSVAHGQSHVEESVK